MTFAPRCISSMISDTFTSRSRTLLAARIAAYLRSRCICGWMPERAVRLAWIRSLMNSPKNIENDRMYPLGLKKKPRKAWLSPKALILVGDLRSW